MEAPHFGEGAFRPVGSPLRKSLLPEIFSTPAFASRRARGEFRASEPTHSLPPFHLSLPGSGGRFVASVRTGSPKVRRSVQGVTQNEEMRQVGARLLEVWSRHPRATREPGHPGVGT